MIARRRSGRSFNYRKHQGGWIWNAVKGVLNSDWLKPAVDAGLTLYGASQSKKAGKKAAAAGSVAEAAQARALDAQTQLAAVNNSRSQEMYDEYMDTALPAQREVLSMARKPIDPNVEAAQAGADFSMQDAVSAGSRARARQRAGVDPSSGVAQESERLAQLDSTAGKAAAMTTARRGATDRSIARIGNAASQFGPLVGAASGFSSQANNGLDRTASAFGNQATQAGQVAGAAGDSYGEGLSEVTDILQDIWKKRAVKTTAPPPVYGS